MLLLLLVLMVLLPPQVGTSTGAMLVFDLRGQPVNPWFQVGQGLEV